MTFDGRAVSVVMVVRNGERYIAEALESILEQSPPPGEVVVVDDGSTDETPRTLLGFSAAIRVIRQDPRNQASATNRAIAETSGPLLAFLDSDDLWMPGSLACRLARLDAADEADGVFGRIEQFVSPELPTDARSRFRFDPTPPPTPMFQALLLRRAAFDRVGPFDESLNTGASLDWLSRARAAGLKLVPISNVVAQRRIHTSNVGILMKESKRHDLLTIVRAHRARRRAAPGAPGTGRP